MGGPEAHGPAEARGRPHGLLSLALIRFSKSSVIAEIFARTGPRRKALPLCGNAQALGVAVKKKRGKRKMISPLPCTG